MKLKVIKLAGLKDNKAIGKAIDNLQEYGFIIVTERGGNYRSSYCYYPQYFTQSQLNSYEANGIEMNITADNYRPEYLGEAKPTKEVKKEVKSTKPKTQTTKTENTKFEKNSC